MKYFSSFSGIAGFELGIQQAYETIQNDSSNKLQTQSRGWNKNERKKVGKYSSSTTSQRGRNSKILCVGYSEIDKYAIQIYQRHFPKHKNYGDITKIIASEVPDHDLFIGGFPCQSFSIAGKRGGFKDTRGTLFFDIARILKAKRPKNFVLENVKGLLSHDKGNTFATIISTIDELGYDCQWSVLNSKNFGVPQNRERVFIVGHIRGETRPKVFPIGEAEQIPDEPHPREKPTEIRFTNFCGKATTPEGIADTLTKSYGELSGDGTKILQVNKPKHSNDRIYSEKGISPTLNTMQGGRRQPFVAPVLTPDRPNKRQHGRRFKEDGEPMFTLTGQDRHGVMIDNPLKGKTKYGWHFEQNVYSEKSKCRSLKSAEGSGNKPKIIKDMKIRRLTPTECERLQGFPDGWTEGISDTQRYKCLGNAVTVNVVREIIKKLL